MQHPFETPSAPSLLLKPRAPLPGSLLGFVLAVSGWHQVTLCLLAVIVFLLNAAPLEVQRRILSSAIAGHPYGPILMLGGAYIGIVLVFGLIKLATNIYRGWVSESATRALRRAVDERLARLPAERRRGLAEAAGLSMVLAECDDVGGFVGSSISSPVLSAGFLVTVFVYLASLQPLMALVGFAVLLPQMIFVPKMQSAINRRVFKRISLLREMGRDILAASGGPSAAPDIDRLDVIFRLNVGIFELKFSMNFLMNLTYSLGMAAILLLGSYFTVQGRIEIATVVTFLSALTRIVDPWNDLVDWARDLMVSTTKYGLILDGMARLEEAVADETAEAGATKEKDPAGL